MRPREKCQGLGLNLLEFVLVHCVLTDSQSSYSCHCGDQSFVLPEEFRLIADVSATKVDWLWESHFEDALFNI